MEKSTILHIFVVVILKTIFFTLNSLIPIEDLKRWPERVATFFALSASLVHWHITTFVHARGKKLHFEKEHNVSLLLETTNASIK